MTTQWVVCWDQSTGANAFIQIGDGVGFVTGLPEQHTFTNERVAALDARYRGYVFPQWSSDDDYEQGDIMEYEWYLYQAEQDVPAQTDDENIVTPNEDPDNWQVF